jgi:hypothetical protein
MTAEERLRANAELVIRQLGPVSGMKFGYDAASVAWLDGFIERQRDRTELTVQTIHGMINTLGSYLGECIIRCFGGRWERDGNDWCVSFDARNKAYPFAKVEKHFAHGAAESIASFFNAIPVLFARQKR